MTHPLRPTFTFLSEAPPSAPGSACPIRGMRDGSLASSSRSLRRESRPRSRPILKAGRGVRSSQSRKRSSHEGYGSTRVLRRADRCHSWPLALSGSIHVAQNVVVLVGRASDRRGRAIDVPLAYAQSSGTSRSLGGYVRTSSTATTGIASSSPVVPYAGAFGGFMPYRMGNGGGSGLSSSSRENSVMGSPAAVILPVVVIRRNVADAQRRAIPEALGPRAACQRCAAR